MIGAVRSFFMQRPVGGIAFHRFLLTAFIIGIGCAEASGQKANFSSVVIENSVPKLSVNGKIMNNMFGIEVFSADVNAETPEFLEDMKKAIDRTAALNIPIFSFQILWHDYDHSTSPPLSAEEAANRFNTTNLDAVLDYAASRRVHVVLPLLSSQHWALPKWWKSYRSNATGFQMLGPPSSEVEAYNRLQTPVASFLNPDHHALLAGLFRRLILRYRDHPALIGYSINVGPTGENGYIPNYLDMWFNPAIPRIDFRSVMGDYSPLAVKNFITFLKRRYSSIEDLNRKWSTDYHSFDEITPPYPRMVSARETFLSNGDNRPSMLDWQFFRYDAIVGEWKFVSDVIRQLDPNKVIMGKTNWNPMAVQSGTEFMQASSVQINSQKLIDIDKIDACLHTRDYMPEFEHTSSYAKLDFVHFSRFSKEYGSIRIFNLDNSAKKSGDIMDNSIALPAKEVLRKEGCYLWFPVVLEIDRYPKPTWSWSEIEAVVRDRGGAGFQDVKIADPPIKVYFDEQHLMPHYYDALPGLKTSGLAFALSKAIYDSDQEPIGFVSPAQVRLDPPDATKTKLLVLSNQRVLIEPVVMNLKEYVGKGGVLLLLGSNGIFDFDGRRNDSALRTLAPTVTERQVQTMYLWGLDNRIKVPALIISKGQSTYMAIDISKDPFENYRSLVAALPAGIPLPKKAELIFVATAGRPTLENMIGASHHPKGKRGSTVGTPLPNGTSSPLQGLSHTESTILPHHTPPGAPHLGDGPPSPDYQGGLPPPSRPQYGGDYQPWSYSTGEPPNPRQKNFMKDWDRNADGVVTRDEFTGDPRVFDVLDLNHDGKITPEEAERDGK